MQKSVLFIVAIIVMFGAIMFLRQPVLQEQSSQQKPTQTGALTVEKKTIKEVNTPQRFTINVEYPQITGLSDSAKEKDLNTKIKQEVMNEITVFSAESASPIPSIIPTVMQSSYTVVYEVAQADNKFVSVEYIVSNFAAGAANPNTYTITFNYDVATGQELKLSDLFKKDSNYLQTLSSFAATDLAAQDKKTGNDFSSFIQSGTSPQEQNFQKFLLTKDGLVLVFDPATTGPNSAGIRKVTVPFATIKSLLAISL